MITLYTVKRNITVLLLTTAVPFLFFTKGFAQTPPVLIYSPVVSGLSSPLDIVNAGDGTNRLFIVQRGGTVRIVSSGVLLPGNFLDIPDSITAGGERGLLSMVFHPGYNGTTNRYFFVYYTNTAGDVCITRYQTMAGNPDMADETTGVILLTIAQPFSNHNGGKMHFGPDGNLYFATGDGGSGGDPNNYAQNGNSLLGKMIRLSVDNFTTPPYYSIPPDNPYVSDPLVRDEIFALGLRNPWRWSFDRLNNDVWIADVGQGAWEEINQRVFSSSGGINYGWRCYEGNAPYNTTGCGPAATYITPIFVYPHNTSTGGFSITGGFVYRAAEFPAMYGYYICADFVSGNAWLIKPNIASGGWDIYMQSGLPGNISGFGEAENGDLFAVALNGTLYKVITSTVLPLTLQEFTANPFAGYNVIQWKTINEQQVNAYEIEYGFNGINFEQAGTLPALNGPGENNYSFRHNIGGFMKVFYRLKITDNNGRITYSGIISVDKKSNALIRIYPLPVTGDHCTVYSEQPIEQISIYSMDGRRVFNRKMNLVSGTVNVPLPYVQKGFYMMQVKLQFEIVTEKVFIQRN